MQYSAPAGGTISSIHISSFVLILVCCHTDASSHLYSLQQRFRYNRNSERSERSKGICSQHGLILPTSHPHGMRVFAKTRICCQSALIRKSLFFSFFLSQATIYTAQPLKIMCTHFHLGHDAKMSIWTILLF